MLFCSENVILLSGSKLVYYFVYISKWPWRIHIWFDLPILLAMFISLVLHHQYHTCIKLYANVPDTALPNYLISIRDQLSNQASIDLI